MSAERSAKAAAIIASTLAIQRSLCRRRCAGIACRSAGRALSAREEARKCALCHRLWLIKDLAKAEVLLGIAYNVAESINVLQFPNVQNNLREMITVTEMVRAAVVAAEHDPVPGPGGTLVPNPCYLGQERCYFLESFPRLLEIVRTLGRAADVDRYYQAASLPADRRVELFALAQDAACSGFAGRNVRYKRFFAGDPWRLGSIAATSYALRDQLTERVWDFLRRSREWDARLGGTGSGGGASAR